MNRIEHLEPRRLFAQIFLNVDPIFELTSKGTLIVHGTPGNDEIVVQFKHDNVAKDLQVFVTPDKGGANPVRHDFSAKFKTIKRFRIEAGDGDDFINISGGSQMTRHATILGGAGDDQILYSLFAPTSIDAGDGNDQITRQAAIDADSTKRNRDALDAAFARPNDTAAATILGGAGDDRINGDTNDQIDGGAGNDTSGLTVYGDNLTDDRRNALAHDYYARLGATSIEETKGAGPGFSVIPISHQIQLRWNGAIEDQSGLHWTVAPG